MSHQHDHQAHGFAPPTTATKTGLSLIRVAALLSDELDSELRDASGVGLNEVLVILQISFAGGQTKMADLADTLVVTRGGVTKIVDRLVDAGYLDRVPSDEDRRVVFARVTEKAKRLIQDNQPVFEAVTAQRIGDLLKGPELDSMHLWLDRLSSDNPGWEPPVTAPAPAQT